MPNITPAELRTHCAGHLARASSSASGLTAFIGLDGFVDEIIRVVDQRAGVDEFKSIPTIAALASRIAAASGKSTNVELVAERTKIGGNGPIMANALAQLGVKVSYVGTLGYPNLHRVFEEFSQRAEVRSIAEPGHSDALEFNDGKIILGKLQSLNEVTWKNLQERYGREAFIQRFTGSSLVGLVNWTMIPFMSDIWEALLSEVCPGLSGPRRTIFFDLADPQKRTLADIRRALELVSRFERHFDVILGLNEKEAVEVGAVLGFPLAGDTREALAAMSLQMWRHLGIHTLVVHPVSYALVVRHGEVSFANGPRIPKPKITTGAGDHFNAGFCFGVLLGLGPAECVQVGVATSGFYVKEARSPGIDDLVGLLQNWPAAE